MITLLSSHGSADFDTGGILLYDRLSTDEWPVEEHPNRLDLTCWKARYPNESSEGEWDILDWSYWTRSGVYARYVDFEKAQAGE